MTDELHFPTGYPYVLYRVGNNYATACNETQAATIINSPGRVKVAKVLDLISNHGHENTNKMLKKFGDTWLCKDGYVFYKSIK